MYLHIAINIYRAWNNWDCGTETAFTAWNTFQAEARVHGDMFAVAVIDTMKREAHGYPILLNPNA